MVPFVSKTMQSNILQILFPARIISDNSIILLIPLQKKKEKGGNIIHYISIAGAGCANPLCCTVCVHQSWMVSSWPRAQEVSGSSPSSSETHTHTHAHPLTLSLQPLFVPCLYTEIGIRHPPPPRCDGAPTPCQTPGGAALNRTWVAFFLSEAGTSSVPAVTKADVLGQCHLKPSPCITSLLFDLPLLLSVPHSFSSSVSLSILHRALKDLASKCFHHDRLLYACIIVGKEKSERLLSVNRFCQRQGDETGWEGEGTEGSRKLPRGGKH